MKTASSVKFSLVGLVAAALIALGAAPASAAPAPRPLPGGQHLYAVGCDVTYNATLMSVDPTTAALTLIGTGAGGDDCAGTPAWDPANQTAYYAGENSDDLYSINLSTGVAIDIGQIKTTTEVFVATFMIGANRDAFAIDGDNKLYSVNLGTAAATLIGSLGSTTDQFFAAAFDPVNGKYYALAPNGDLGTINIATGAFTQVGTLGSIDQGTYGIQFDSAGTLWVQADGGGSNNSGLWTYLPKNLTGSGIKAGTLELGGSEVFTDSLLIPTKATAAVPSKSVAPGASATVTGAGFVGGETVSISLDGSSTVLATVTASATGLVGATVTIPAGTATGAHTFSLVGPTSGTATAAVTVAPVLAKTGVDAQTPLELGGILLALGIAFILSRRVMTRRTRVGS